MTPRTPAPALTAEEARTVARFDAAQTPPEVVAAGERETVARALYVAAGEDAPSWRPNWDDLDEVRQHTWLSLAAAAIAADPSPAEEAMRRVDPLAFLSSLQGSRGWNAALRFLADEMGRAALASPASAPQGEEGQR